MDIEDFIKLGERIKMREEIANASKGLTNVAQNGSVANQLSDSDINFIQKEFQKDVLEREWSRLYQILNQLKSLSNSLVVHEIKY